MYEDKTYENILSTALSEIDDDVLKIEGSLVRNAISALAKELEKAYAQLDYLLAQMDPEQADFENLKKLASQRAIYPSEATYAVVQIEANVNLPVGARFNLSAYNYAVTGTVNAPAHKYTAVCEEAGSGPNGLTGKLTPITYVEGLEEATITAVLVAGEDADGKEELLEKYKGSFKSTSFAGNVAAYKEKLLSMDGVGGCKVYPVWNGAGTVKLVLQGSDGKGISDYLIEEIQEEICPEASKGYGFAPIGHTVTCISVEEVQVNITTEITFGTGYSWETCEADIIEAIEKYIASTRKGWGTGKNTDTIILYISRLEAAVLDVEGVIDIQDTTLNGQAVNLQLEDDQIPVRGSVVGS